jgi:hypothetical protein
VSVLSPWLKYIYVIVVLICFMQFSNTTLGVPPFLYEVLRDTDMSSPVNRQLDQTRLDFTLPQLASSSCPYAFVSPCTHIIPIA